MGALLCPPSSHNALHCKPHAAGTFAAWCMHSSVQYSMVHAQLSAGQHGACTAQCSTAWCMHSTVQNSIVHAQLGAQTGVCTARCSTARCMHSTVQSSLVRVQHSSHAGACTARCKASCTHSLVHAQPCVHHTAFIARVRVQHSAPERSAAHLGARKARCVRSSAHAQLCRARPAARRAKGAWLRPVGVALRRGAWLSTEGRGFLSGGVAQNGVA